MKDYKNNDNKDRKNSFKVSNKNKNLKKRWFNRNPKEMSNKKKL